MPRLSFALALTILSLSGCASTPTTGATASANGPSFFNEAVVNSVILNGVRKSRPVEFFQNLFKREGTTIEAVEIGRSQVCNSQGRESVINLFRTVQELRAWEVSRGVQLTSVTDRLPTGTYALVEMGERNTGGWAILVSRQAAHDGAHLVLKASYLSPKTSGMAAQMISSPCALMSIRSNLQFTEATLLDQTNKQRASWSVETASMPVGEAPVQAPARLEEPLAVPATSPADAAAPSTESQTTPEIQTEALEKLPLPDRTPSLGQ